MRRGACASKTLGLALVAALALATTLALASCAQDVKITSKRQALIYGVKNYLNKPLIYTVDDSNSMNTLLFGQGWNTLERTDAAVTKATIRADILALSAFPADGTILLYFSGHGTSIDSSWGSSFYPAYSGSFIVPYDSIGIGGLDTSSAANLISPAELAGWLAQAGTKNIIVILDTCNSGGFVSPGSAIDASPQDYSNMPAFSAFSAAMSNFGSLLTANASASGQKTPIVLSASGTIESSWEAGSYGSTTMAHGVFTYFLLEAAKNGDLNGDGIVTISEAYQYTSSAMQAWGNYQSQNGYPNGLPFLPHLSGGVRDLVLFAR